MQKPLITSTTTHANQRATPQLAYAGALNVSVSALRGNLVAEQEQLRTSIGLAGTPSANDRLGGLVSGSRLGLLNEPRWGGLPPDTKDGLTCKPGYRKPDTYKCSSTVSTGAEVEGKAGSAGVEAGVTATPKEDTRPVHGQPKASEKKGKDDGPADATGNVSAEAKVGSEDAHVRAKVEAEKPADGKATTKKTVGGKVCVGEDTKACVEGKREQTDKDTPVDSTKVSVKGKGGSASVTREQPRDGSAPTDSARVSINGPGGSSLSIGISRTKGEKPSGRVTIEIPLG